jgi:tetratricopeptide (TPR) repeat protein
LASPKRRNVRRPPSEPPVPPTFNPLAIEREEARVEKLLGSRQFASIEEANAFVQDVMSSGFAVESDSQTALEEAQDVVYEAMEATGKRRIMLARRALKFSPDCADAYLLLMEEEAESIDEVRSLVEQAVAAGERALGPEFFEENAGHFWGLIQTRPYMRARFELAELLWRLDEREAALDHLRDMLRLNPDDNQGLRFLLASRLPLVGADKELTELLATYESESGANWSYNRALHAFRRRGDVPSSRELLENAFLTNPYVPLYLVGGKPPPEDMPEYYSLGDEREAVLYLADAAETWASTRGALPWLVISLAWKIVPHSARRSSQSGRLKSRPPS